MSSFGGGEPVLRMSRSRWRRPMVSVGLAMVAMALAFVPALLSPATPSSASPSSPFTTGPIDPVNGFPQWYQDANGLRLGQCLGVTFSTGLPDARCIATLAGEFANPNAPVTPPGGGNFPPEFFYWFSDATVGPAGIEFATEGSLFPDAQGIDRPAVFDRMRLLVDPLPVGAASCTAAHPYGQQTYSPANSGELGWAPGARFRATVDVGNAGTPGVNFGLMSGGMSGPWLRWDTGAPAGYIGDGSTPHAVVGGPNGNSFTFSCVNGAGTTIFNQTTNLWVIQGHIFDGAAPPPPPATRAFNVSKAYVGASAGNVSVTVSCTNGTPDLASKTVVPGTPTTFTITPTTALSVVACTATEPSPPVGYTANAAACLSVNVPGAGASCTITNTQNPTNVFTVNKVYVGADGPAVTISPQCTSGTVTPQTAPADTGVPAVFTVTNANPGVTCTATESNPPATHVQTTFCNVGVPLGSSCTITNTTQVRTFVVNKAYVNQTGPAVSVSATCNNGGVLDAPSKFAATGAPAVFTVIGNAATINCSATEPNVPAGFSLTGNTCTNVVIGGSCTMTNTGTGPPAPPAGSVYLSLGLGQTLSGVVRANEDILIKNGTTWSFYFDGSDVGLGAMVIDAFQVLPDGILLSFTAPITLPNGVGLINDWDIVKFTPTSTGATTAGSFAVFFRGTNAGLNTATEDIDALFYSAATQKLYLSTNGAWATTPAASGTNRDVLVCNGFTPGQAGACSSVAIFFDGDDILLTTTSENIDAFHIGANGIIYFSTTGAAGVTGGLTGIGNDVFACATPKTGPITSCGSLTKYLTGNGAGLVNNNVTGVSFP